MLGLRGEGGGGEEEEEDEDDPSPESEDCDEAFSPDVSFWYFSLSCLIVFSEIPLCLPKLLEFFLFNFFVPLGVVGEVEGEGGDCSKEGEVEVGEEGGDSSSFTSGIGVVSEDKDKSISLGDKGGEEFDCNEVGSLLGSVVEELCTD